MNHWASKRNQGKRYGGRSLSFVLALALLISILPGKAAAAASAYQYGAMQYFSTISQSYVTDSYCCSDQWFFENAADRNEGLALVSAQLAAAAADPTHGADFLRKLGFQARTEGYDSPAPDDCAYTLGTKTIQKDGVSYTLAAVAFQGADYGCKGWLQNVTVNGETSTDADDHASFFAAAKVFLSDFDKLELGENVIVWLTGQSRGGAIANLAAARLLERNEAPVVFARTFESPTTASSEADAHSDGYAAIHNYISDDDLVTLLPPWEMTRYGQDIPYNTETPTEDVLAVAKRLNPDAASSLPSDGSSSGSDAEDFFSELVRELTALIPQRTTYSAENTVQTSAGGSTTKITFDYQDSFRALCRIAFDGEGSLTEKLMPLLSDRTLLAVLTYSYLEEVYAGAHPETEAALLNDAVQKRWAAANGLCTLLAGSPGGAVYEPGDIYGLLTVLRPLLLRAGTAADALPEYDEAFIAYGFFDYLNIAALLDLDGSLFSHHSDAVLARLHLLAAVREYTDVPAARWSWDAVTFVSNLELFNGTGESTFTPKGAMTRGMFMTVLARCDGMDAYGPGWKEKGMAWSVVHGISDGTNPDEPITREELVTMLWRDAGEPEASAPLEGWTDVGSISAYSADAMAWAVELGILKGHGNGVLDPKGNATREQVAQLLMNDLML